MPFASLGFILLFLPGSILLYYLTPQRLKNGVLLLLSLLFCLLLQPQYLLPLLLSVLADYGVSLLMQRRTARKAGNRVLLGVVLLKDLALLAGATLAVSLRGWEMPVGLLVCSCTAAGYLADLAAGRCEGTKDPCEFFLFCLFFGKLPLGPLVTWERFSVQLRERRASLSGMYDGMLLLLTGLAKQVLLADPAMALYRRVAQLPYYQVTTLSAWAQLLGFSFAVLFYLWAFCDMARGLGLLFSFELPRNIEAPLRARGVGDFFHRFNGSVTAFLERYVLQPLGGESGGALSAGVNLLLVCMLAGLWLGLGLNYLLWGAFLALFVMLERLPPVRWLEKLPTLLQRLYTLAVLLLSVTLMMERTPSGTLFYLRKLFQYNAELLYNDQILLILSESWWVLPACLLFCNGLLPQARAALSQRFPRAMSAVHTVWHLGLLGLTLLFLL